MGSTRMGEGEVFFFAGLSALQPRKTVYSEVIPEKIKSQSGSPSSGIRSTAMSCPSGCNTNVDILLNAGSNKLEVSAEEVWADKFPRFGLPVDSARGLRLRFRCCYFCR